MMGEMNRGAKTLRHRLYQRQRICLNSKTRGALNASGKKTLRSPGLVSKVH
jgi:hypothetical protein